MNLRRPHFLFAPEGDGAAAPAAAEPVAATAATPATAEPAPTEAVAATPAASPAASPAVDSLLKQPPQGEAAAAAPAGTPDWVGKVPEKFHVKGADGALDMQATLVKQAESYAHLERTRGATPPATAADYTFEVPDSLKDKAPEGIVTDAFRERMHKLGLSQEQFTGVMSEYFDVLPEVLNGALQLSAAEARQELSKVWTTPTEFEAGLSSAQRAVDGAPQAIRQHVWERFGRDPVFLQFAASIGREMREDTPPTNAGGGNQGASEIQAIMQSKAYRDPSDPQHAVVSQRVRQHFERTAGAGPIPA